MKVNYEGKYIVLLSVTTKNEKREAETKFPYERENSREKEGQGHCDICYESIGEVGYCSVDNWGNRCNCCSKEVGRTLKDLINDIEIMRIL